MCIAIVGNKNTRTIQTNLSERIHHHTTDRAARTNSRTVNKQTTTTRCRGFVTCYCTISLSISRREGVRIKVSVVKVCITEVGTVLDVRTLQDNRCYVSTEPNRERLVARQAIRCIIVKAVVTCTLISCRNFKTKQGEVSNIRTTINLKHIVVFSRNRRMHKAATHRLTNNRDVVLLNTQWQCLLVYTRCNLNQTTITTRRCVDKLQGTTNRLQRCLRQETGYISSITTISRVYITNNSGCSWAEGLTNSNSTPTTTIVNLVDLVTSCSTKPLLTYLCSARRVYICVDNDIMPCSKCSSSSNLIVFVIPSTRISTGFYNIVRLNLANIDISQLTLNSCSSCNLCITTTPSIS